MKEVHEIVNNIQKNAIYYFQPMLNTAEHAPPTSRYNANSVPYDLPQDYIPAQVRMPEPELAPPIPPRPEEMPEQQYPSHDQQQYYPQQQYYTQQQHYPQQQQYPHHQQQYHQQQPHYHQQQQQKPHMRQQKEDPLSTEINQAKGLTDDIKTIIASCVLPENALIIQIKWLANQLDTYRV